MTRKQKWLLALPLAGLMVSPAVSQQTSEEDAAASLLEPPSGRVFYVRQTVGDDTNDGLSPETAWLRLARLTALEAGDTAYVGPGLYRDQLHIAHSGTAAAPIRIVGDSEGRYTGDPPGSVLVTGAEPIDESIFEPHGNGLYKAKIDRWTVGGVVEMDGPQFRYWMVKDVPEFRSETYSPVAIVEERPSSFYFDKESRVLYLHTSDGRPPSEHEIEILVRGNGIAVSRKQYVTVAGFTFRHWTDAGIRFSDSSHCAAVGNIAYGNRQGVRAMRAPHILAVDNVFFRNENSGIYFLRESTDGVTIGNTLYENIKGLRWGSQSNRGLAANNASFDNLESGIAIEDVSHVRLNGNRLVGNEQSQLFLYKSHFESEGNCFDNDGAEQFIVKSLVGAGYRSLAAFQEAGQQDRSSREGGCGSLPEKLDVHRIHAETTGYLERARRELASLASEPPDSSEAPESAVAPDS